MTGFSSGELQRTGAMIAYSGNDETTPTEIAGVLRENQAESRCDPGSRRSLSYRSDMSHSAALAESSNTCNLAWLATRLTGYRSSAPW